MSESVQFDFLDLALRDLAGNGLRELSVYLSRFPGHETVIAGEYQSLRQAQNGGSPGEGEADQRIANYRVLGKLGDGGQGTVLLAQDLELERVVALKVLDLPLSLLTPRRQQRLRREAEAIARLDHPSICRLFEARLEEQPPFLAMEYVPGRSLDEILKRARNHEHEQDSVLPLPPQSRAELWPLLLLFEGLAGALAAAHDAGVVHRDVKPGNIMVRPDGDAILLDFGLASVEDAELHLTRSGDVFGTPSYMAPEQMNAGGEVDGKADLYALAATLYECLTLRLPHKEESWEALRRAVLSKRPQDPRQLNPAIPEDLCLVLESALAKRPEDRCPSAEFLKEELSRIRRYQPILTSQPSRWRRLQMWVKREPRMAVGLFTITGLMLVWLLALGHYSGIASENLLLAETMEKDLLQRRRNIAAAELARDVGEGLVVTQLDATLSLVLAKKLIVDPDHGYLDTVAIEFLSDFGEDLEVAPSGPHQKAVTVSEDGSTIAWFKGGSVQETDVVFFQRSEGTDIQAIPVERPAKLALDTAGHRLAVQTRDMEILLVDLNDSETSSLASEFPVWPPGGRLEFSPGGKFLVVSRLDEPCRLAIWEVRTGRKILDEQVHGGLTCAGIAFSSDGSLLATFGGNAYARPRKCDRTIQVWDLESGNRLKTSPVLDQIPTACRFSPHDADCLWIGTEEGTLYRWDWRQTAPVKFTDLGTRVFDIDLAPDGSSLAAAVGESGGKRATAFILDPTSGVIVQALPKGRLRSMTNVEYSPDGTRLATAGWDDTLRLWDTDDWRLEWRKTTLACDQGRLFWFPDGERILVHQGSSQNGFSKSSVLHADRGTFNYNMPGHQGAVTWCGFQPSGQMAVTASLDGTATLWDPSDRKNWKEIHRLDHSSGITAATFADDGRRLITGCLDGSVHIWNLPNRARLESLQNDGEVSGLQLSPSGDYLAVELEGGGLRLWDLRSASGRSMAFLHQGEITSACFGGQDLLLTTGGDSQASVWDCRKDQLVLDSGILGNGVHGQVGLACGTFIDPEGRWIAVGGLTQRVHVLDTQGEFPPLAEACNTLSAVRFSPSEGMLIGTHQASGKLFRFRYSQASASLSRFPYELGHSSIANWFSAEAGPKEQFLACHAGGAVVIWPPQHGRHPIRLRGHAWQPLCGAIHPDGRQVVAGYQDGVLRIWSLAVEEDLGMLASGVGFSTFLQQRPDLLELLEDLPDLAASLGVTQAGDPTIAK